jgi:RNA polymerase-binding transcription factor DksA
METIAVILRTTLQCLGQMLHVQLQLFPQLDITSSVSTALCCQREEAVGLNVKWKRRQTAVVVRRHMDFCYCEKCGLNIGYKRRSGLHIC